MRSEHIAIVGARGMGHEIAQVFAAGGHEVILFDADPYVLEKAIEKIRSDLTALSENGLCLPDEIERTFDQIKPAESLKDAIADARFVVESAGGDLEAKQALFREMEAFCSPITILATHTSIISITDIASVTKVKERVIGTHFWGPLHLMPIVEVVGGRETLQEVKEYTCNILKSVGKYPVMVERGTPGLIGKRLRDALRREALSIVAQGMADPKAVNEVVKKGLSLQLSISGPLDNPDLGHPDQTLELHEHLLKIFDRLKPKVLKLSSN